MRTQFPILNTIKSDFGTVGSIYNIQLIICTDMLSWNEVECMFADFGIVQQCSHSKQIGMSASSVEEQFSIGLLINE